jgi:peptide deformylase
MIREIRKIGDPILRRKAKKVDKVTRDTKRLIDDMLETMRAASGQGLAAPQIGIGQRVAVVEVPRSDNVAGSGVTYALVNPEIVTTSDDTWEHQEGCLSIPGWRGDVARPFRAVVRALDRDGNRIKIEVEGHVARTFLHEIDHLDGVLYIDKLVSPDRVWRVNEDATEDLE